MRRCLELRAVGIKAASAKFLVQRSCRQIPTVKRGLEFAVCILRVAMGPWDAKGPWGPAPSHYEWLAITIGQRTVSGNSDGAMTGRPETLGALQF